MVPDDFGTTPMHSVYDLQVRIDYPSGEGPLVQQSVAEITVSVSDPDFIWVKCDPLHRKWMACRLM